MKLIKLSVLILVFSYATYAQEKYTISGRIGDSETGEELIGATIYESSLKIGTSTNVYGFYSLTLPKGVHEITVSYIGYKNLTETIDLKSNQKHDIHLNPATEIIKEVEVVGKKADQNIEKVEMSTVKLTMKSIKKIPTLMGEVDVIKSIQLLPGVQAGSEGSSGFHVRGGSMDQNQILLDDAIVYNASHVAGFFSVFNSDAIKDVKLYKGGIPAEYGGKLSSILDVRMNDGNSKKFSGTGGIGIISSRLTFEGPIIKDKSSFIISGRRTYADLFLPILTTDSLAKKSKMYFYDFNTKINYTINENNRLFLSGYFGNDVLAVGDMMGMIYGNATGTLRWNHQFNSKLFMNTTLIYSKYNYKLDMTESLTSIDWRYFIEDYNGKLDFSYYLNPNNTIKFGFGSIYHTFEPGIVKTDVDSENSEMNFPNNNALEHSAYLENEQKLTPLLSVQYGLRFSAFQNIGEGTIYSYDKTDPQNYVVNDTTIYAKGKIFNTNTNFEPRLSVKYTLNTVSSLKASYNRTAQYIHLATNSTAATPLDVWFPCSPNVKPQLADQVALGYFRNFKSNTYESSVEVYYKKMQNAIDFKDHASLLLNRFLEGELRIGDAYSYGLEFLLKKQEGKFTGWVAYTLSKTMRKIPEINQGREYSAPYDKTHNVSIVVSYEINKKVSLSANWVYSTAPPRTMPTGRFEYGGMIVPVYSDRNSVRIFDYHRLDLSCSIDTKNTKKDGTPRKWQGNWNFSLYNAYARKNPITVNFKQSQTDPNKTYAEIMYLFKIVPSITYNFKF